MKSMTGFGGAVGKCSRGIEFAIEIRTYNRKQLDIKFSLPPELFYYEASLRRRVSERISRGSINIKVKMSFSGEIVSDTININQKLAEVYLKKAGELKEQLSISGDVRIVDVLRLPNVLSFVEPDMINSETEKVILDTLNRAFDNLDDSRSKEGAFLAKDFQSRIDGMEAIVEEVEPLAEKLPEFYKDRLYKKVQNLGLELQDNDERVLRELVIYSDKCDVTEEITRLKSHFQQFKGFISCKNKPVGRSLDFLLQEIQREVNTMGVKAASPDISKLVVTLKTDIEKIREQVQNIE